MGFRSTNPIAATQSLLAGSHLGKSFLLINTLALRLEAGEAAQREQRRDWLRELDVCWSRKPVPTARIHSC